MSIYRVEEMGESALQERLNTIASEGWTLITCTVHGVITEEGRPVFVTIWSR